MKKKSVLSGMRPSGKLHLGNLLGALHNWVELQEEYDCFYFIADWHALTTDYSDTSEIKENIREMVVDWLSAGIDPEKSTIFIQSHLPEHAELHLLLSMITPLSWLERVPSYKEQQQQIKDKDLATYGFLGYPMLQAADIIIYKADYVPVGIDQVPHIELTREIAKRFNFLYKKQVFPIPEPKLTEFPKIPGVDGRKMSKSYNNCIYLSDSDDIMRSKINRMMTDPQRARRNDPGDPEVCPVFTFHKIYSPSEDIEKIVPACKKAEIGCVDCKKMLIEKLVEALKPFHEKRQELLNSPKKVEEILRMGVDKARKVASATLAEVKEAMQIDY